MGMGKIASSLLNLSKIIEDYKNWLIFTNGRHTIMSDVITCYLEKKIVKCIQTGPATLFAEPSEKKIQCLVQKVEKVPTHYNIKDSKI